VPRWRVAPAQLKDYFHITNSSSHHDSHKFNVNYALLYSVYSFPNMVSGGALGAATPLPWRALCRAVKCVCAVIGACVSLVVWPGAAVLWRLLL
jgi:hypothetical protein